MCNKLELSELFCLPRGTWQAFQYLEKQKKLLVGTLLGGINAKADTMIVISHTYHTRDRLALGQPGTARVGLLRQVRHYYHKKVFLVPYMEYPTRSNHVLLSIPSYSELYLV